ncbi:MAG: hypothetical protein QOJ31_2144 [Gaiellales bacterium]|jgi:hypothetical protein|nr:hypothetical protein [Gaiellales bacterium]MDX6551460.1 hypothetical protein [Gaiellales bacterium]
MNTRTLRVAGLAVALTLIAATSAFATPRGSTPIDEMIDLTGVTIAGGGCSGGDITYTSGWEHVTGDIRTNRSDVRASYDFTAVDSLTGERFRGAGSRHQVLRDGDSLFHINLRLAGDHGSRIMLTGTLHLDASGQTGKLVHAMQCIHSG